MRIGQGFDAHRFGDGSGVVLGGVWIAHDRGIVAHSDGDVLAHALADALLGAAGLGDIGRLFPDSDPTLQGADSRNLLRDVVARLTGAGLRVVNADATVVAQAPRVAPHVEAMQRNLASDLGCELDAVSIKATTTDRLGFTGRDEGIAALAVVLLEADR